MTSPYGSFYRRCVPVMNKARYVPSLALEGFTVACQPPGSHLADACQPSGGMHRWIDVTPQKPWARRDNRIYRGWPGWACRIAY
ncbi:hypothetical protein CNY67_09870 [Desulfovibrio sp. G11]|nr:hypothetical protein CNY67_09870 [Desulfovibrio sp. G11]